MEDSMHADSLASCPVPEAIAEAWLIGRDHAWAFEALERPILEDPEGAWSALLSEHGARFVDRVESLVWSSSAFALALENIYLIEADWGAARRLIRVGCQVLGIEHHAPGYVS